MNSINDEEENNINNNFELNLIDKEKINEIINLDKYKYNPKEKSHK